MNYGPLAESGLGLAKQGAVILHQLFPEEFNLILPSPCFHFQKIGSIPGVPHCINATAMYVWLNQDEVRQALHIPSTLPDWELCR